MVNHQRTKIVFHFSEQRVCLYHVTSALCSFPPTKVTSMRQVSFLGLTVNEGQWTAGLQCMWVISGRCWGESIDQNKSKTVDSPFCYFFFLVIVYACSSEDIKPNVHPLQHNGIIARLEQNFLISRHNSWWMNLRIHKWNDIIYVTMKDPYKERHFLFVYFMYGHLRKVYDEYKLTN